MLSKLKSNKFVKQVLLLAGGSALAQIINLAVLPVLTRLYSPSDFGVFAVMTAVTVLGAVIISLRYENAILAEDTLLSAKAGVYSVFWLSCILGVSSLFIYTLCFLMLSFNSQYYLVGLVAIILMMTTSWMQALYIYSNRNSYYGNMTKGRIYGTIILALISISWGLLLSTYWGLILGSLGGMIANLLYLFKKTKDITIKEWAFQRKIIIDFLVRNRRFPKFLVLSSIIDRAGSQGHIIIFSNFFGGSVAGGLSLYNKVAGLPSVLIGTAIGDVFKRNASEKLRENGHCTDLFYKTGVILFLIASIPFLILLFFGPPIFALFFGDEWRIAGVYAQILSPVFLLGFIVSPLSTLIYLEKNQKFDLFLQTILFFLLGITLTFSVILADVYVAISAYAFSYVCKYIVEAVICWKIARGEFNKIG